VAEKKRILFYGDSLTWGWVPMDNAVPTHRYPFEQRLTGVTAAELGDGRGISAARSAGLEPATFSVRSQLM
jgi:lysophospholipase L1-like esterase